jgi:hypothetical protein
MLDHTSPWKPCPVLLFYHPYWLSTIEHPQISSTTHIGFQLLSILK